MPELDLGSVIGPQGPKGDKGIDGAVGPVGPQGEKGDDGAAATINGVNAMTMTTGDGLEATMTGSAYNLKLTDKALNAVQAVPTLARPNLLDNWYFGRPVNQRGQTSYTGTNTYTIDRWMTDNTVTVVDGRITVKRTGHDALLYQYLEESLVDAIAGKVVTYSALTTSGLMTVSTRLPPSISSEWDTANAVQGDLTLDTTKGGAGKIYIRLYSTTEGTEATIIAAKLELGPTQTLAHQENGQWVLNEVPEEGEQLARCQRYFRRIAPAQYAGFARGCAYNADSVRVMIPFETMRTTPNINLNNATGLFASNSATGDVFGLSFASVWTTPESITFDVSKTGAFVDGKEYILRGDQQGYIDVIADL